MAPNRLTLYGLVSTSLFAAVTLSALNSRPNYYAAAVSVGRSSGSMMVLANFGLFGGILLGVGVKRVFFGRLRAVEYEHLFERLWMFLTESLLALTIFRDDFSAPFAIMYGVLVFLKCFHWITADRVDYMDQIPPPGPPTLFHLRAGSIITLLATLDLLLVLYSLDSILTDGVSAMVLFASEFMILLASIWGTMARYVVSCLDLRRARGREDAPAWEQKSMYMFYIDLAVDFTKLLTYLTFFSVILLNYGIPLHILRDVWMTFRSFISRCSDLVRYRRATRDMDAQYPNATEDDVGRLGDRVCIICREEMIVRPPGGTALGNGEERQEGPNETPKKLVCGHVFHFHCLRSWLERQQSCPTCRRDVLQNPMQNNRNRRATPAPPAPAAPAGAPAPDQAERLRAQFEHFFRQPGENGAMPQNPTPADAGVGAGAAAPTAPPTTGVGMPGPTPTIPAATTTATTAAVAGTDEEGDIQRSIWGGPIQPGRFFAPPLGALPRYRPHQPTPGAAAGPASSSRPQATARPEHITTSASQNGALADHTPALVSAAPSQATTPFSSNPPEVFRSTSRSPDPSTGELTDAGAEVDKSNSDGVEEGRRSRRLAAEAAMKRLGIPSSSSSGSNSSLSTKGKEKAVESIPSSGLDVAPSEIAREARTPYLTLPHFGHPHPHSHPTSGVQGSSVDRDGVESRLRTLRAVDETIWRLIEDLTKLKSQWEVDTPYPPIPGPEGDEAQLGMAVNGKGDAAGEGVRARRPVLRSQRSGIEGHEST